MALLNESVPGSERPELGKVLRRDLNTRIKGPYFSGQRLIDYITSRNYVPYSRERVVNLARNHSPFLSRMNLMKKLPVHHGCVNTICWNKTGEYILSGSDDCNLCITKPTYLYDDSKDYTVLHNIPTRHFGNIFSAQFIPNSSDHLLVSCSSEGPVIVHDINSENPAPGIFNFNCHASTIFKVETLEDDDKVFLSCSEDKTVRLFDMRCHRSCARAGTCPHPPLIRNSHPMTTLTIHPLNSNLLLVGRADGLGLVYDRRRLPDPSKFSREQSHLDYLNGKRESNMKYLHPLDGAVSQFCVPDMEDKCRFTSLEYSPDGSQVLASYSQDYIYLFNHDTSSNFELIQTLQRSNSASGGNDGSANEDGADNQNGGDRARCQRNRAPRIRVRGDWSDTGINSVPHSTRSGTNSSQQPNFLQRMTEVALGLGTRRNSGGTRFVPITEIIAGPMSYSATSNNRDSNSNEEEGEQQEHEEQPEQQDASIEDETEADIDGPGDTFEFRLRLLTSDQDESEDSSGPATIDADVDAPIGQSPNKPQVSPQSKMKFQKTFAEPIKNRLRKIVTYKPRIRYQGHRNSRTSFKQAIFWGEKYIMSGSDCGRIIVWEKETAKIIMAFPADERVVNCLAPNPQHYVLASSGIDYDIKLWSTQSILEGPLLISQEKMDMIVKNNELMLEEAKQTITVPPHLFFRVLASFSQNRLN